MVPTSRTLLVVDAEGFSRHRDVELPGLYTEIRQVVERACERSGLGDTWKAARYVQNTGDGVLAILPADTVTSFIHPFADRLQEELAASAPNLRARGARLRLRAAVHVGLADDLDPETAGISAAANDVSRLVDCEPVKNALRDSDPDVTFTALIVSTETFDTYVMGGHTGLRASQFRRVRAKVKQFDRPAYLYVPLPSQRGSPATPGRTSQLTRLRPGAGPGRPAGRDFPGQCVGPRRCRSEHHRHPGQWRHPPGTIMNVPFTPPYINAEIRGDANQNAVGNTVTGDLVQTANTYVRRTPSMYLGAGEIADRVACYAPARNHDLITKTLEVNQAIVLTGPSGSGRETTAIAAIRQLQPDISIRRFFLEDEDIEEIRVRNACGYVLHATDGGMERLARCADAVREAGGYLAMVADHGAEHHPEFMFLSVRAVEPAHPVEVYRARVNHLHLVDWLYWDQVSVLLEHGRPADGRRLADIVSKVDEKRGDLANRQAEAMNAYRGWHDELLAWFGDHREPSDRALLVAASTLSPGANETLVYSAAASLAQRLEIEINGGGLAWCPLTGLPNLLMAERQAGLVMFRRHGYADSALAHTLADYPLARADLLDWLADLPTDGTIQGGHQNLLAQKFADRAAEHDAAILITATARRWGEENRADLAFIALWRPSLHPRVGGRVRRALYEWSREARTPQTLKLTIARVCEPLGQAYPSIALTRLKHLATYGNPQVRDEVLAAAQSLAGSGHHAEVLRAALAWCAETNDEVLSGRARARRRRAGAGLFLGLVLPGCRENAVDPGQRSARQPAALCTRLAGDAGPPRQ